jgi:hypothetical protein
MAAPVDPRLAEALLDAQLEGVAIVQRQGDGPLRPYGPNGKLICFACGMQDEETSKHQFLRQFD